jgi:glycosyltransferase involved in cell wall biosynthesis
MNQMVYTESSTTMDNQPHNIEKNLLVSIVIGNYNYEKFINQAIDSALNQTYQNIEVIVVDDGSKDKSRDIIVSYGNRLIPIFKENGGQPSNYNAGFAASRGELICFLDSDDIFLPNKVADIVRIFESNEEVSWCFHSLQLVDAKCNPLELKIGTDYISAVCDFRNRIKAGKIPPYLPPSSALCFRRSLLEKILPMPTTKSTPGSDHYVKFMAVALTKGFLLGSNLTLQRIHDSNMGTLRSDVQRVRAREYLFTSKWIRQEFPQFKKFANKLCAVGIMFSKNADNNDFENHLLIQNYLKTISLVEKFNIDTILMYFFLRGRIEVMLRKAKKTLELSKA